MFLLYELALFVGFDYVLTLRDALQVFYVAAPTVQTQVVYLIPFWYRPTVSFPNPAVKHKAFLLALSGRPYTVPEVAIVIALM